MSGTSLEQLVLLSVSYQGQEIFSRPPAGTNASAPLALRPLYSAALEAPLDTVGSLSVLDLYRAAGVRWW